MAKSNGLQRSYTMSMDVYTFLLLSRDMWSCRYSWHCQLSVQLLQYLYRLIHIVVSSYSLLIVVNWLAPLWTLLDPYKNRAHRFTFVLIIFCTICILDAIRKQEDVWRWDSNFFSLFCESSIIRSPSPILNFLLKNNNQNIDL